MSNEFSIGLVTALLFSAAVYIYVAFVVRRSSSLLSNYIYGGVGLSDHAIFGTIYASGLSFATVIVALLQLGTFFGISLSWAILTYCAGWIVFILVAERIRTSLGQHETIHTFLGRNYDSRRMASFSSIATIVGFVGSFAIEILAIYVILGTFIQDELAKTLIVSGAAAVTILYAVIGGFPAVIKTDRYQSYLIIITILLILLISFSYREASGLEGIVDNGAITNFSLPIQLAVSLFLINVAFPIVDMASWQRVKAASSVSSLKRGAIWAVIFFLITWGALLVSSMALTGIPAVQSEPIVSLLGYVGEINGVLGFSLGFVLLIGLLAAMFSTSDTFLNAAATTLFVDQLKSPKELVAKKSQSEKSAKRIKSYAALLGAAGFIICLALNQIGFGIVALIFALYGGTLALFPAVALALYRKDGTSLKGLKPWAIGSVVMGFAASWIIGFYGVLCSGVESGVCVSLQSVLVPDPYQAPVYAFGCSFFVMAIGIFLDKLVASD